VVDRSQLTQLETRQINLQPLVFESNIYPLMQELQVFFV
jgi:hypothetical protein